MVRGMQTEWERTISVGRATVTGTFQLLGHNVYNLLDDMMSEQIITGDTRTLGMKLGRIKEALIINGIAWDKSVKNDWHKSLSITHPDFNGGQEHTFRLQGNHPLTDAPLIPTDGEFMSGLGDGLAGLIVELNPGLSDKYGSEIFGLFVKKDDEDVEDDPGGIPDKNSSDSSQEPRGNPTESETSSQESEGDTSTSGPISISEPHLVQ